MSITREDLFTAARTVYGEARGEGYDGQVAVAWVLRNRLQSTSGQFAKDNTLSGVCLRHAQFSAWNANDPNFGLIQQIDVDDTAFLHCLRAVIDALTGEAEDKTGGATHYHTKTVNPGWSRGVEPSAVIGNHKFYTGIR